MTIDQIIAKHFDKKFHAYIDDTYRISNEEIANAIQSYADAHFPGKVKVYKKSGFLEGRAYVKHVRIALAIYHTIELLATKGVLNVICEAKNREFSISFDSPDVQDIMKASKVSELWRNAGFHVQSYGFYLTFVSNYFYDEYLLLRSGHFDVLLGDIESVRLRIKGLFNVVEPLNLEDKQDGKETAGAEEAQDRQKIQDGQSESGDNPRPEGEELTD
ncbi:MAG: hypothetical protein IKC32_00830 [Clostridia bacterium]|nr:hypothetical protein [Clostridia bacterium]